MNLRKKNKPVFEVSTASMNDIMFFLMLFFLIMSTLLNPSVIKLTLPNSQHSQAIRSKEIYLSVTRDLQYFIDNKAVPYEQLEQELSTRIEGNTEATVVLRCDNSLSVQNLVSVLEIGNKLNVKMILATKSVGGGTN